MGHYICPKCGATQKTWMMPRTRVWKWPYTFRCQSCVTMLRLVNSEPSRWFGIVAFCLFPIAWVITHNVEVGDAVVYTVCAVIAALALLLNHFFPAKVVVHPTSSGQDDPSEFDRLD